MVPFFMSGIELEFEDQIQREKLEVFENENGIKKHVTVKKVTVNHLRNIATNVTGRGFENENQYQKQSDILKMRISYVARFLNRGDSSHL